METSTLEIIKTLQKRNISVFSLADFRRLFAIKNAQTLYKKIQRLEKDGVIEFLVKGKYLFILNNSTTADYEIANFLYPQSYVSLESALSYYGIITGFPYGTTSITVKKPRTFKCQGREFNYSQIAPALYFGMEKDKNFLIASPEKALIDYIYFGNKGLRGQDFDEMDFSIIDRKKLALYAKMANIRKFPKIWSLIPRIPIAG